MVRGTSSSFTIGELLPLPLLPLRGGSAALDLDLLQLFALLGHVAPAAPREALGAALARRLPVLPLQELQVDVDANRNAHRDHLANADRPDELDERELGAELDGKVGREHEQGHENVDEREGLDGDRRRRGDIETNLLNVLERGGNDGRDEAPEGPG